MNSDEYWMGRAIDFAQRALGRTAPNPAVGAVLVRAGEFLGAGFTQPVGGAHAEVKAIEDASARHGDVRGATMYVTLEPCCHFGRTPPCTDAILEAGIARVVVGVKDHFPAMQGKGLEQLRQNGVQVHLGVRSGECAGLVRGFTRSVLHGMPQVTCKVAMSLDGNIATSEGESQWITSEFSRVHSHGLRANHDGIVVGIGTALADDPSLTCRTIADSDPRPVLFDTNLRIPSSARLFEHPLTPIIVCGHDAPERDLPATIVRVERTQYGVNIRSALRALTEIGLHRILVEGGAQVHRSFLDSDVVDSLYVYIAGLLIPGGKPWIGGPALGELSRGRRLPAPSVQHLGSDILLKYELNTKLEGE